MYNEEKSLMDDVVVVACGAKHLSQVCQPATSSLSQS
jgi:hypothetical protein